MIVATARKTVRTYYFDMRDGVPLRDRKGLEFPTAGGAIEHSKNLARQMRDDPRATGRSFSIVVMNQSGTEVQRELVAAKSNEGG